MFASDRPNLIHWLLLLTFCLGVWVSLLSP
jgi:hypothetical protein